MPRITKKSVTCFLHHGEDYLFIHRTKKGNSVDVGRLNGIGGKLELGENFLTCAIRETQEETGYAITPKDCHLAAVVSLEEGYLEDWIMCFFVIEVKSKDVPLGLENDEGSLMWLHKDEVLTSGYELVDDLNYCWDQITEGPWPFFAAAILNENEKITNWQLTGPTVKT
ncbi:MAG: hypothetical protein COU65_03380 [Candidatus Pacebacteria bacterium CG10_big_fil_rev_8_21_14_0_10_42_12]|nr:MAG: hypothetical protein COU65_03380 [Candidatus Pacebacteria bacterium CG10_big_fil_rev_8_21_14_0_10_42_12]